MEIQAMPQDDPYLYASTNTLINKKGIRDQNKLEDVEERLYVAQACKPLPTGNFDYSHLKAIHKHFLGDLYEWAGEERIIDIIKGDSYFAHKAHITASVNKQLTQLKTENYLQNLDKENFVKKAAAHFNELNAVHPFREGNGRTLRAFFDLLTNQAGYKLDWTLTAETEFINASIQGFNGNDTAMAVVFDKITTSLNRQKQRDQLLSEPTKKELQEYLKLLNNYRQIAAKAVQHFNKPDEKYYKETAKEAKAAHQQKAQVIVQNQLVWNEVSRCAEFSVANLNANNELQTIAEKLNNDQIIAAELGAIQTNIKETVQSLNTTKTLNKGRHR